MTMSIRTRLRARFRSRVMRLLASETYLNKKRRRARIRRRLGGEPRSVHYFHQVDDPYSHLIVQKLDLLQQTYAIPFTKHLVSLPADPFLGSAFHYETWAIRDAASIASDYGTEFTAASIPDAPSVQAANEQLADALAAPDFARLAFETGTALWAGDMKASSDQSHNQQNNRGALAVRQGNALREKLGHYLGGTFYYEGEWFWGIDRIRLLETRLIEEGLRSPSDQSGPSLSGQYLPEQNLSELCVPEPGARDTSELNKNDSTKNIVLEYFPSLRSPYTAIGHQRVLDLIERSGVTLKLRPVMPMMMRGIPAPGAKGQYIISDAGREARYRQVPFGNIVDPFGEPVRQAFALFPAALAMGKGMEFVTQYLSAAWAEGVDITHETGLKQVIQRSGLDWQEVKKAAAEMDWEALLERNVEDMLAAGLWGVPSFRVTGGNDESTFACWGQDRIWRVENEIARRAGI